MSLTTEQRFFCAELSRNRDEKIYGTAPPADFWLLLEYSKAWGTKALKESDLPASTKTYLEGFLKTNPVVRFLFIRRSRSTGEDIRFFVVRCLEKDAKVYQFNLKTYEQLLELDIHALVTADPNPNLEPLADPLFLVCTHGTHDKCCAKFGGPVYDALKQLDEPGVWQSSHVGGDRFAANMICFPHAIFYGRVEPQDAPEILRSYLNHQITLHNYRGRGCYARHLQAAEFFVRSKTGITGINDLTMIDSVQSEEGMWRVRFSASADESMHEVTLASFNSEFQSYHSCRAIEESNVEQYRLCAYTVVRIV